MAAPSTDQASKEQIKAARENVMRSEKILSSKDHAAIEQELEGAKVLISKNEYHGNRPLVTRSQYELGLAEEAVEEDQWSAARTHLQSVDRLLGESLQNDVPQARSDTLRQDYATPPGDFGPGELQASVEEKGQQKASEFSSKNKNQECRDCDQTSLSGEWMKGASETGVNK